MTIHNTGHHVQSAAIYILVTFNSIDEIKYMVALSGSCIRSGINVINVLDAKGWTAVNNYYLKSHNIRKN